MNRLRQIIKNILKEGLHFDQIKHLALAKVEYQGGITYLLFKPELANIINKHKNSIPEIIDNKEKAILGVVHVENIFEWDDEQPCNGAMMVSYAAAEEGWGPTLYDIVMGDSPNGIIADRETVSIHAYDIWDFYNQNREDVEKKPLDWKWAQWTEDPSDDCLWGSNANYYWKKEEWMDQEELSGMDVDEMDWEDDPLNWSYNRNKTPHFDQMIYNFEIARSKTENTRNYFWGNLGKDYFRKRLRR